MRRTVTYWPAWCAKVSRRAAGISTVTQVASSAARSTPVTFNGWKLKPAMSNALEVFEGFEAGAAAMQGLAGRGTKFAQGFRFDRMAAGTCQRPAAAHHVAHVRYVAVWGNDSVFEQLAPAIGRDPVAGPRRRQHIH